MKKILITNAVGTSGKDKFAELLGKYVPVYKYSIINLVKEAGKILGCDPERKTEEDRAFLSDMKDLASRYNDSPYKDIESIVSDFINGDIKASALIIDMRDPIDIDRAVKDFGAQTILIRNPRTKAITSNHADRDVENYTYDYIIENDGSIEQLEKIAKFFARDVICQNNIQNAHKPFTFVCSKY